MQPQPGTTPAPLGDTMVELMALLRRRQELELRLRRCRGEERESVKRKLAHAQRLVRAYFR